MLGLYERDYSELTQEEIKEKEKVDAEGGHVIGAKFGRRNFFYKYPKAVRHNMSLFPNNYMDIQLLKDESELVNQCDGFETLLNNTSITELDIKRYIQSNGFYHIPASIFKHYDFGHHEAALFKEFPLGTKYIADYLLVGRASGGWQFIFVEFENPYGRITLADGNPGEVIRKGLNQIDEWKPFIEGCYSTLSAEFEKYTVQDLPREFTRFDSTRMHYVVVAGRRADYNETTRLFQRRSEAERNIKILHYDNILDDARNLIGAKTY